MVEWLAGNRIRGTNAERTSTTGFNPLPAVIGGWKELDRVTVGAGQTSVNLDVTSLTDKRYYMILHNHITDGTSMRIGIKLNGDDGTPYSYYETRNQGSNPRTGDTNNAGGSELNVTNALNTAENWFGVAYLANKASENKLYLSHYAGQNATGGYAPERVELAGKWTKGTDAVNQITASRVSGGGVADSGSELIVLGYDPADTHTTNFWEELASVDWSSGATLDSGVFSTKKYLWVQAYLKEDSTAGYSRTRCGNSTIDTLGNYAGRWSITGGNDGTQASNSDCFWIGDGSGTGSRISFVNMFIVNNASNEKLFTGHSLYDWTTGVGTAPRRVEFAHKWTNTLSQINRIDFNKTAGNYESGTTMRVWGSD